MARRRSESEEDALYMGLDMVCNAFGGIIFITLLLASMPVGRAIIKATNASPNRATAAQVAERFQLESAIAQIRQSLATMTRMIGAVGANQDPNRVARDRAALQHELNEATASLQDATGTSEDLRAKLERELRLIEQRKKVDLSLQDMIAQLGGTAPAVIHQKRLFRIAPSGRSDCFIVLCGGKVYEAAKLNGTVIVDNENDFRITTTANVDGPGARVFEPRPDRGTSAAEWLASPDGFAKAKHDFPNSDFQVTLLVYPDGIDDFATVLSAFNSAGYRHDWGPMGKDESFCLIQAPPRMGKSQ